MAPPFVPDPSIAGTLNMLAALDRPIEHPSYDAGNTPHDDWQRPFLAPAEPAGITELGPLDKAELGLKMASIAARIRFARPVEVGAGWRIRLLDPRTGRTRTLLAQGPAEDVVGWNKLWIVVATETP